MKEEISTNESTTYSANNWDSTGIEWILVPLEIAYAAVHHSPDFVKLYNKRNGNVCGLKYC